MFCDGAKKATNCAPHPFLLMPALVVQPVGWDHLERVAKVSSWVLHLDLIFLGSHLSRNIRCF